MKWGGAGKPSVCQPRRHRPAAIPIQRAARGARAVRGGRAENKPAPGLHDAAHQGDQARRRLLGRRCAQRAARIPCIRFARRERVPQAEPGAALVPGAGLRSAQAGGVGAARAHRPAQDHQEVQQALWRRVRP
eukprot:6481196-Prymnesium_polylepis.1